ncbi:intelectin-like [Conger conger]|uniref:intelectin-like n=1 Tax=Conger conger TaxID=82655 RepID=UPI002A5AAF7C|nr:intelectin-like [Conger conger]
MPLAGLRPQQQQQPIYHQAGLRPQRQQQPIHHQAGLRPQQEQQQQQPIHHQAGLRPQRQQQPIHHQAGLRPQRRSSSPSTIRPGLGPSGRGPPATSAAEIHTPPLGLHDNLEAQKLLDKVRHVARSCKELKEKYNIHNDGLYYLTTTRGILYEAFCDMSTAGGGWTLVLSVHENNLYGKCTLGDRWSSQQGNNPNLPEGDGTWSNKVTFGSPEAATSDDYKNSGYFDITAKDVSVWHVRNNAEMKDWTSMSILRYHTETSFLTSHGGNLYQLFKQYPVRFNVGVCNTNKGPAVPIVYDFGNAVNTANLYGPYSRNEFTPGFITFRVINNEKAPSALCSGVSPTGCNTEHYCVGGGGNFPEGAPLQCGDFAAFGWSGYGTNQGWSASLDMTESALLLFYR